jgi:hypothetical protein
MRQMSERLARAGAFALEAEEVYDEVPDQSPRRQLTNLRRVAMRRPDRLVGDTSGDAMHRTFWYDGKVFAAHDSEQNVWASGAVPPTVDQALDWVFEQTGTVIPLGDFLYADVYARLMGDVQRGVYLGIHEAAGVPCHHLSFEQATIDWQIVASTDGLFAQRHTGSRGSVSAASRSGRTTTTRQGNTTTTHGQRATGTRTVEQSGDGYNVNRQVTTDSGGSKSVSKEVNVEDKEVDRSSTTTNQWGQSVTREREVQGQGGYATIEGSAKTSTGREASADLVADRNRYGQPAVAGSVNTKYSGNYNVAAARNPYGGWNTAVAGPYGGKVTRTLPSGYRTTTYYGRPYYSYGGAYYRPYMHGGVPYYYPVPMPYYAYYDSPPVGAVVVMVLGVSYLMSKDGSYSKKTTSSEGKEVYQSVPRLRAPASRRFRRRGCS